MWLDGRSVILEQGRVLARRGTVRHKSILEHNETREEKFAESAREKEREILRSQMVAFSLVRDSEG